MRNLDAYIENVKVSGDLDWLRRELIERMRLNVGLITENTELKRRVQQLEQGKEAGP